MSPYRATYAATVDLTDAEGHLLCAAGDPCGPEVPAAAITWLLGCGAIVVLPSVLAATDTARRHSPVKETRHVDSE